MGLSKKQVNRTSSKMPRYGDLLIAVAERKDEAAFSSIYQLISNKAFSLAYQITHSKELSEEAVQDAMLRVWRYAGSYNPSGNPRNWILTIVATSAVAALNKHKNAHSLDKKATRRDACEADPNQGEQNETLTELHRIIETLPQGRRQILALYFGAGMPQHAIGKTLNMPQRTVSDQFLKTLNVIKTHLKEAGFAAAFATQDLESSEAICSGWQLSSQANEHIQSTLSDAISSMPQESARWPKQSQAASGTVFHHGWLLGAIVMLAATGTLIFQAHDVSDKNVSPVVAQPLNKRWSFNEGPPTDLVPIAGQWSWLAPSNNKRGAMRTPPNNGTFFLLPMSLPEKTCVITLHYRMAYWGSIPIRINWMEGNRNVPRIGWVQTRREDIDHRQSQVQRFYIHEHRIYYCRGTNQIHAIEEYKNIPSARRLGFGLANFIVEEISIQEIHPEELPASVQKAHQLKAPENANNMDLRIWKRSGPKKPFKETWDFEKQPLPTRKAKIKTNGSGARTFNAKRILVPYKIQPRPHKITIQHATPLKTNPSSLLTWNRAYAISMPHRHWTAPFNSTKPNATVTHYVLDRNVITFFGTTLISISEYEIPYPSRTMSLTFRNTTLRKITQEVVKLKDLPPEVQDVGLLIKQLEKQGVQSRKTGVYWNEKRK